MFGSHKRRRQRCRLEARPNRAERENLRYRELTIPALKRDEAQVAASIPRIEAG
jgi:hypothetical protein